MPLLELYTDIVRPDWIDYNQHMSEGYYGVAFGHASDAFIDYVGLHADYRARTGGTVYTVESHIFFLRELKLGTPLHFRTQLLGYTPKKMHIFHEMLHAEEGFVAATFEVMMLHIDRTIGRSAPMPPDVLDTFAKIWQLHEGLPRPGKTSRPIHI